MNGPQAAVRAFHGVFAGKESENCGLESLISSLHGRLENSRLTGDYSYVARSFENK